MKIVTIIGARPQFIKAAAFSAAVQQHNQNNEPIIKEVIVHTGQHFDANMSAVFFEEMQIPKPDYLLDINSLGHGAMTGRMLEAIEKILIEEKPDWVLVYGDTNSTLAGALAASKLHIKVAHVEAGLRSFNMKMPEEINRILTDRISKLLLCPSESAIANLKKEGFEQMNCRVINVGDIMYDTTLMFSAKARKPKVDLPENYALLTMHRAENTDDLQRLKSILSGLIAISKHQKIVWPIHPRTKKILEQNAITLPKTLITIDPVGYLEMLYLIKHSGLVLTDSGGLQKEAYFLKKYCITLRDETEWVELVEQKFNFLCTEEETLLSYFQKYFNKPITVVKNIYGSGDTAQKVIESLLFF